MKRCKNLGTFHATSVPLPLNRDKTDKDSGERTGCYLSKALSPGACRVRLGISIHKRVSIWKKGERRSNDERIRKRIAWQRQVQRRARCWNMVRAQPVLQELMQYIKQICRDMPCQRLSRHPEKVSTEALSLPMDKQVLYASRQRVE